MVIPRVCGVSSTPRPIDLVMDVSGILDHPHARVMTNEYAAALSRRVSPELLDFVHALKNREGAGNAGCRLAPAVSCADSARNGAHEHTGTAGARRHSLRSGFTAYAALSLETNSFCLHRRRIEGLAGPVGPNKSSADLTPATGARTTRFCRTRMRRSSCADLLLTAFGPPCNPSRAKRLRVHRIPHSTYRDDAYAPLH
jgi:hypothetical protein